MTNQTEGDTDDFSPDVRQVANIGKRFYTWSTLGTFAGASFLVGGLWRTLQRFRLGGLQFTAAGWPFLLSAMVIVAFAFATEPAGQTTSRAQKTQKALITVANTLLVFFTVLGGTAAMVG